MMDNHITPHELRLLSEVRQKLQMSQSEHEEILARLGFSVHQFLAMQVSEEFGLAKHKEQKSALAEEEGFHKMCVVCLDGESDHILLDCMHICFCEDCAELFQSGDPCPECRQTIVDIKKIPS